MIFSALKLKLTLMFCLIYLLLATVHHFGIGERPGLVRLFGFGQVSRLRDEGSNEYGANPLEDDYSLKKYSDDKSYSDRKKYADGEFKVVKKVKKY